MNAASGVLDAFAGETFLLRLDEPMSYVWELEEKDAGVELLDTQFEPPRGAIGGSGVRHFHFRASEPGTYCVVVRLRRPWEATPQDRRSYHVSVHPAE